MQGELDGGASRGRLGSIALILGLFLAAAGLRLHGIGFLLPHYPEPDGVVLHTQVELLEEDDPHPERDFNFGFYPLFIARVAALVHRAPAAEPPARTLEEHLSRAASVHVAIRAVVAILAALAAPATWLLARRFLSPGAALVAALFMAASMLNVWFAQQARPHAAAASFALIGVVCAIELRRRGSWREHVACGLALALAVGSLQSGLVLVPAFLTAMWLRTPEARRHAWAWSALPLVFCASAVVLFYPYMFVPSAGKDAAQLGQSGAMFNLSGHLINLRLFNGGGLSIITSALARYDPWMSALAVIGGVLAIACVVRKRTVADHERARDLVVVLAYAVPYFVAVGLYQRSYQRFVLPLLPFVACLAAYAVERAGQAIGALFTRPPARAVAACACACIALGPQVWIAAKLVSIRSSRDTASLAADWVLAHVDPAKERVAIGPGLDLPLAQTSDALAKNERIQGGRGKPWYHHQRDLDEAARPVPRFAMIQMLLDFPNDSATLKRDAQEYLRGLDCDYAVVEVYEGPRRPLFGRIRTGLAEHFELVERISPDSSPQASNLPLAYQDDDLRINDPWAWRVLHARTVGPVIEIYRLRK